MKKYTGRVVENKIIGEDEGELLVADADGLMRFRYGVRTAVEFDFESIRPEEEICILYSGITQWGILPRAYALEIRKI